VVQEVARARAALRLRGLSNELLDVALTYLDLHRWLEEEGIDPNEMMPLESDVFVPEAASEGALYPVEGGMNETIRMYGDFKDVRFMTIDPSHANIIDHARLIEEGNL
jgi:hypothetical protein